MRVYVADALAGLLLVGCITRLGAVLQKGVAVVAGGVLAVCLLVAGLAWTALTG